MRGYLARRKFRMKKRDKKSKREVLSTKTKVIERNYNKRFLEVNLTERQKYVFQGAYLNDYDFLKVKCPFYISQNDVNCFDNGKLTPLMVAATNNNVKILNFLVRKGASVNVRGARGWTALHFAFNFRARDVRF